MNIARYFPVALLVVLFSSPPLYADSGTIKGKVTDEKGNLVSYADSSSR